MASIRSRLLYFIMKNRHLLQFRLQQEGWDCNTSVEDFRMLCAKGNPAKLPEGIKVLPLQIDGMYAEWIIPGEAGKDRVILYCAGGGYISGCCDDHRGFVAKLARQCGVTVLLFDHRLAPEDPFPAALEDTLSAYSWLLNQSVLPAKIVIAGESAGGGLCLAALLALRDQDLPLPAAAVAIAPWTDLALTGESHKTMARYCLSPRGMSGVCARYYAGDHDPCLPYISPLYGDLQGLPPLLINVGEWDCLMSDSTRFAEKAKTAGVDVTLRVGTEMVHCYPLLAPLFPEASAAMQEICTFIRSHI